MKQVLTLLLCLAALHALPKDAPTTRELFQALDKEAQEKITEQPAEWRTNAPDQITFLAWHNARVEQSGMDILKRYTELFKRYPNTEFIIWQQKQSAYYLWNDLQRLKKPEYQKYLDDWKALWPGDNVIERQFYNIRRWELAKQFPDMADAEKIARNLRSEYPVRREPYRALLSLARRKSAEAYETTLQEILRNADTPETIKAYLQGKTGKATFEDEPYDYRGKMERGDMEIDHYEIRYAQLSACASPSMNQEEKEEKIARALITEFPNQTRSYGWLFFRAGKGGEDHGATRDWLVAFVKGPAPEAVKTELQENYHHLYVHLPCYDNFWWAMGQELTLSDPKAIKAWLDKYLPLWRAYLDAHTDFIEGRLKCSDMDSVKRDAIYLLTESLRMTADPQHQKDLKTLNVKWLGLPVWNEEERMKLRSIQLYAQEVDVSAQMAVKLKFKHPALAVYPTEVCEKVTRTLMKEFPKQAEPYENALILAERKGPLERTLLQEILDSQAPASIKKKVQNMIGQMNRVGQPLELKGTAVDGRNIDVQQMKGKVVLIDFWTTWCPHCINEEPLIKSLYDKSHEQGFEVIGVNLEDKQETLKTFLIDNPTPWPQYWNKSWAKFGINGVPTLWLVDRKGIVRDVNAREDLEQKVEKLLAEP
jgi:thiol-disulfide isomerase/thioredoxin